MARRNDDLLSRKASTLVIRCRIVSGGNGRIKGATYLLLAHATMQFGSFQTRKSKDHSCSVGLLLLTKENNDSISIDIGAEIQ